MSATYLPDATNILFVFGPMLIAIAYILWAVTAYVKEAINLVDDSLESDAPDKRVIPNMAYGTLLMIVLGLCLM